MVVMYKTDIEVIDLIMSSYTSMSATVHLCRQCTFKMGNYSVQWNTVDCIIKTNSFYSRLYFTHIFQQLIHMEYRNAIKQINVK